MKNPCFILIVAALLMTGCAHKELSSLEQNKKAALEDCAKYGGKNDKLRSYCIRLLSERVLHGD